VQPAGGVGVVLMTVTAAVRLASDDDRHYGRVGHWTTTQMDSGHCIDV